MKKIVVSACLLGENCKYNGGNNYDPHVEAFCSEQEVIRVCPEVLAGFGIPRTPIEIVNGVVMDQNGNNVDQAIRSAVSQIMEGLPLDQVQCAVLKSRSPTCGVNQVYDGTFTGTLIPGAGVLAQALKDAGCTVIDADDI